MTKSVRDLDPELQKLLDSMKQPSWLPMLWVSLIVLLAWGSIGFLPWYSQEGFPWNLQWGLEQAGSFGDSFGFINSLFSGIAMAGVIVTLWYQRQELGEQRKELVITQWELRRSAKAHEDSQKALSEQAQMGNYSMMLAALEGLQASAMNAAKSDPDESRAKLEFVDRLREIVVTNALRGDKAKSPASEISERLAKWGELTHQMSSFREIDRWVQRLLQPPSEKEGVYSIVHSSDDVNTKDLRLLMVLVDRAIASLSSDDEARAFLVDWYAAERDRIDRNVNDGLLESLRSLQEMAKQESQNAMYARVVIKR